MPVLEGRLHPSDEQAFDLFVEEHREEIRVILGQKLSSELVKDPSVRNVCYFEGGRPGSYLHIRAGGPGRFNAKLCRLGDLFLPRFDVEVKLRRKSEPLFLPKGSTKSFLSMLPKWWQFWKWF